MIREVVPDYVTFGIVGARTMFAGGFIWVFCDEAPKRSDKGGILDSDKSNAPDGVVGPRREKRRKLLCYPRTMVAHPVKTAAELLTT